MDKSSILLTFYLVIITFIISLIIMSGFVIGAIYDTDTIGSSGTIISDDFITNVVFCTPPNGSVNTDGTQGIGVTISFLDDSEIEQFWTVFWNRTDYGYTQIGTSIDNTLIEGGLSTTAGMVWAVTVNDTTYRWGANVSHNETGQWWNMSSHGDGWRYFTTNFSGESVVYDTDTIGSSGTIISSGGPGAGVNMTNNSGWWEFYKLDKRWDLNGDGNVNSLDRTNVWAHRDAIYVGENYLQDCNNDGTVTALDRTAVWGNRD